MVLRCNVAFTVSTFEEIPTPFEDGRHSLFLLGEASRSTECSNHSMRAFYSTKFGECVMSFEETSVPKNEQEGG